MNLLFITSDHQRADSIGMIQAGRAVTPVLNALASQGTRFTKAYSACPLCVPARAALATGLRPARNGVTWNDWTGAQAKDCTTIHEYLASSGFVLGHIGMDHVRLGKRLRERTDFAAWLDEADHERHLKTRGCDLGALETSGPFRKKAREQVGDKLLINDYSTPHAGEWPFAQEDFRDEFFVKRAEETLEAFAQDANPFALFVNLWAPHPPFYVPPELMNLFPPDEIQLPANIGEIAAGEPANRREGVAAQLAEGVSEAEWRRAWSAHLALTYMVDSLVGRLLASLEQQGIAEETLVVFTSDHGDHLGQHAMYQKMELYDQASRVPLIVRGPGIVAGQQIESPVSHLDLLPTVLDFMGPPVPENLDGRSLVTALRGQEMLSELPVFIQFTGNNGPSVARHAIVFRNYKLIHDSLGGHELYDLANDPLEMKNRIGDLALATIEAELTQRIHAWLAETAVGFGST